MVNPQGSTSERVARLEAAMEMVQRIIGTDDENVNLYRLTTSRRSAVEEVTARLVDLEKRVSNQASPSSSSSSIDATVESLKKDVAILTRGVDSRISRAEMEEELTALQALTEDVALLKRAIVAIPPTSSGGELTQGEKFKVPEPKAFGGARSSKELENFLWDMEQYFKTTKVATEQVKVDVAAMYLNGDAKQWWWTRCGDESAARIGSWDEMKRELKAQFLPTNVSWMARESLRKLKQTGSVRDYVREFSSLLLDVKDMSEQDKLFNFMQGLQNWAQTELNRQGVQTLPQAVAAAEKLVDFKSMSSNAGDKKPFKKDKGKSFQKDNKKKAVTETKKGPSDGKSEKRKGCFKCDGPHFARDCPHREMVNAIIAQQGSDSEKEAPPRVNPMQLLCAISGLRAPAVQNSLMYIKGSVNGIEVMPMVDCGATHSFMTEREARRLKLKIESHTSKIKTVNAEAEAVLGRVSFKITIEGWSGLCNVMVVRSLDDFNLILGKEWMYINKAFPIPHLDGIMIADERSPVFVKCTNVESKMEDKGKGILSAMQVETGLKRGEQTFLAAMIEVKPDVFQEVPQAVAELLDEFRDIMPPELPKKLPPRRTTDHKIELVPGARPPAQAPYRMSPVELVELRRQLDELLEGGLMKPSKAPYGAPALFQKKADGSLRFCVDYRALNKITIKNKYPVPNTYDLFDRLVKGRFFTKIDLRAGYWQVRIAEGDEEKTTVVTRYGSYEFLVMPFGLTNAPATFCNLMNDVLYEYLDEFVVVYLDDIVVYSETLEDHLMHLRKVFHKLSENELYVKKEKCEFCLRQITFLGHILGEGQIKMDPKKVAAVVEWPAPTKVPELRSFLGLANYYRRFIKGYSKLVAPLTDLLKKGVNWEWHAGCEEAFDAVKRAIATEPVLQLPDFNLPFEVHTDASDRALGGVLVQNKHPVAFESRKLKDCERRYTTHEKEMTAVVHCLEMWKHYLMGTKFTVVTDNVANTYFKTQKKLTPKQARWQEFLAEFDFEWQHRPGRENAVADALSRKEVGEYVAAMTTVVSDFMERVRAESQNDPQYVRLKDQVEKGLVRRYWLEGGLLYAKGGRAYVPSTGKLRRELLRETHDTQWAGHPGVERMRALLSRRFIWPKMEDEIEAYVRSCLVCQLDKTEKKKEAGLLQPLPIPERPWQSISMDFVGGFPKVEGMSSVLVVVDRFSKYAVFMAAPNACPADKTAELFFKNVVKHFGLPEEIISDRDARFTGRFWTQLFNTMGSQLKFSTANHPQTDGQTERINGLLEEYLRHYVTASQRNWLELLDVAQFCYNLHKSSATGVSPFELANGQQPLTPQDIAVQKTGGKCPAAYRFARAKQELIDEARDSLQIAQQRMKKYADAHRRDVEFQVGDLVLLKITPQIWKKISSKTVHRGLVPRYDGPFEIVEKVGNVAYRLKLPDRLKVHPTFHVSYLKKYFEDSIDHDRQQAKRAPPVIRSQFEKELGEILNHETLGASKKNRRTRYLVHWKGEDRLDAEWVDGKDLWQFEDKIADYLAKHSGLPGTSTSSSGGGLLDP